MKNIKKMIVFTLIIMTSAMSKMVEYQPTTEVESLSKNDISKVKQMLNSDNSDLVTYLCTKKIKEIDWGKKDANDLAAYIYQWHSDNFNQLLMVGQEKYVSEPQHEIHWIENTKLINQASNGIIAVIGLDKKKASGLLKRSASTILSEPLTPFREKLLSKILEEASKDRNSEDIETSFTYIKEQFKNKIPNNVSKLIEKYELERKYTKVNDVKKACLLLLESIPSDLFDNGIVIGDELGEKETNAFKSVYDYNLCLDTAVDIFDNDPNLTFTNRIILLMLTIPHFPNTKEQAEESYYYFEKAVSYYQQLKTDGRCTKEYIEDMDQFLGKMQESFSIFLVNQPVVFESNQEN